MTTGRVLKEVVRHPKVVNIPMIAKSDDPEADLRMRLNIEIMDEGFLIRVVLELENAEHAATIVNTVVDTYFKYTRQFKQGENAELIKDLNEQLKIIDVEIAENQGKLRVLAEKGDVRFPSSRPDRSYVADLTQPTFASYTQEHVQKIIDQIIQTDLELIEAQAALEARLGANQADGISKSTDALNEAKIRVAALIKTKEKLAKLYERLKIAKMPVNSDSSDAAVLNYEVSSLLPKREQLKTNLRQLEFEAKRDFFRVILVDEASVPKDPVNTERDQVPGGRACGHLVRGDRAVFGAGDQGRAANRPFLDGASAGRGPAGARRRIRWIQGVASSSVTNRPSTRLDLVIPGSAQSSS